MRKTTEAQKIAQNQNLYLKSVFNTFIFKIEKQQPKTKGIEVLYFLNITKEEQELEKYKLHIALQQSKQQEKANRIPSNHEDTKIDSRQEILQGSPKMTELIPMVYISKHYNYQDQLDWKSKDVQEDNKTIPMHSKTDRGQTVSYTVFSFCLGNIRNRRFVYCKKTRSLK